MLFFFPHCTTLLFPRRGTAVKIVCHSAFLGHTKGQVQRFSENCYSYCIRDGAGVSTHVLPLCLVHFWVIHVATGKFEFTVVKGDRLTRSVSQCFHLPALWPWANYFLYPSVSLSVKWDNIHISAILSIICLNISEKKVSIILCGLPL